MSLVHDQDKILFCILLERGRNISNYNWVMPPDPITTVSGGHAITILKEKNFQEIIIIYREISDPAKC